MVENVYALEKAGGFTGKGSPAAFDFTIHRLAAASQMLLDLWYTAWIGERRAGAGTFSASSRDEIAAPLLERGGPGQSRTADLRFRKPLLYPSELRGQWEIAPLSHDDLGIQHGARSSSARDPFDFAQGRLFALPEERPRSG
jgi:hypothetical protein